MQTSPISGTVERTSRRESIGMAVVIAGAAVYGAASAFLIAGFEPHFEFACLALQLVILLPAFVYGLRFARSGGNGTFALNFSARSPLYVLAFVALALAVGYKTGRGILIPDESGYRFQATVFNSGELSAPAPLGAANTPHTPQPVDFVHLVVHNGRWFSKYPVGWPAVLAIGEKFGFGWAAAPLLGGLLLIITGLAAHEAFGRAAVAPSLWIAVLSPYWLATCVGRLSGALCAVLVAGAVLFCLRAMRARSLPNFALMYALLVAAFLVRPLTALVASSVLGVSALLWSWRDRALLIRTALLSVLAGGSAVGLTVLFNFVYTGSVWLSPYALSEGIAIPYEITAGPGTILRNLVLSWRFSAQSIVVFTFPFVFLLAAYGLWSERRLPAARVLAAIFPALVIAYLADAGGRSSIIGDRYWFEGFFGVTILAGQALVRLVSACHIPRRTAQAAIAALTCAQLAIIWASAEVLYFYSQPYAAVRAVADRYRDCHCAVFIGDTPEGFFSRNMDMNTANWQHAHVFYFNDPGPGQRELWAKQYGWNRWAVITYNRQTQSADSRLYRQETADPQLSRMR